MMLAANRILDTREFGVFYTVVLVITVAVAPMMALILVLGRVLANVGATFGLAAVAHITTRVLAYCLKWGIPAAVAAGFLLWAVSVVLGLNAWELAFLTPAAMLILMVPEVLRASFQSLLLFGRANAVWVASQAGQCVLGVSALLMWHRVWPGILGIMLGAALASLAFVPWFRAKSRDDILAMREPIKLRISQEMRLVVSYSLFVLITNIDILLAYWLLPSDGLGVYAASAFLPKAIVTATFPVAQVVLPVVVEQQVEGLSVRHSILAATAMAVGMGIAGAGALWVGVSLLQASPFAIRGLDLGVMRMISAAAVGIGAVRVLVVAEIALGRSWLGVAQAACVVLVVAVCGAKGSAAWRIAEIYAAASWGLLLAATATLGWIVAAQPLEPVARRRL
jgi:O-antigen/teichoic acid export membrane protein